MTTQDHNIKGYSYDESISVGDLVSCWASSVYWRVLEVEKREGRSPIASLKGVLNFDGTPVAINFQLKQDLVCLTKVTEEQLMAAETKLKEGNDKIRAALLAA